MGANDFRKLGHGPYGTRWSFTYGAGGDPPTVAEAERILGVKLAGKTYDASAERDDGLGEAVYFAAEEYDENTVATYRVQ